jgi:hypothetical protein
LTFLQIRSFAFGELGWSRERYLNATLEEFNHSVRSYWEDKDWQLWHTREILWQMIQGNPNIKPEDKPKRKDQIYKLGVDKEEVKKKAPRITEQDLKVYEALNFNKQ